MGAGTNFEWNCARWLQQKGYLVIRSPMSKGPYDLMALENLGNNTTKVRFYQCKRKTEISKLTQEEYDGLIHRCVMTGGNAYVLFKLKSKIEIMPIKQYQEEVLSLRKIHKDYLLAKRSKSHVRSADSSGNIEGGKNSERKKRRTTSTKQGRTTNKDGEKIPV